MFNSTIFELNKKYNKGRPTFKLFQAWHVFEKQFSLIVLLVTAESYDTLYFLFGTMGTTKNIKRLAKKTLKLLLKGAGPLNSCAISNPNAKNKQFHDGNAI